MNIHEGKVDKAILLLHGFDTLNTLIPGHYILL